jgi:mono/diheme cytochrome c family protein
MPGLITSQTKENTLKNQLKLTLISGMAFSLSLAVGAQDTGAATYKSKCAMCHGADGLGATPAGKSMKAIPFNSPELVKASDADLIAATKNGKGKMPAYSGKLTDPQITEVVAYIRTLQK